MSDLIERQAAIDAIDLELDMIDHVPQWVYDRLENGVKELPSAQPEQLGMNLAELGTDCISRKAAIDAIQKAYAETEGGEDRHAVWKNVGLTNALHIMQDLPSAQPMRKKGKWIVYKAPDKQHCGLVKCPFCGEDMIAEADEYNFYPNCGADMRGDAE